MFHWLFSYKIIVVKWLKFLCMTSQITTTDYWSSILVCAGNLNSTIWFEGRFLNKGSIKWQTSFTEYTVRCQPLFVWNFIQFSAKQKSYRLETSKFSWLTSAPIVETNFLEIAVSFVDY